MVPCVPDTLIACLSALLGTLWAGCSAAVGLLWCRLVEWHGCCVLTHHQRGVAPLRPPVLQDLSASWQRGAADLASSSSSSSPPPSSNPSNAMPQPQQPPATNSDEAYGSSAAAAPSGLPPLGEGYHPLEFYPTSHIDLNWGTDAGQAAAEGRARCFVILFGVGRAETEGIYSLRAVAKDDGLPVDTIVAFENEDDALRWAGVQGDAQHS